MTSLPGKQLKANGLSFHVVDEGEGTPVLLLHGFPDSSYMWRNQIPALTEAGYRVIAPDLRGFGESDKPQDPKAYQMEIILGDLDGILNELGVVRSHVVGHDWGAATAWTWTAFMPQRVDRLVTIAVGHINSFRRALLTSSQALRSWYMLFFQLRGFSERVMARNVWALGRRFEKQFGPDFEKYLADLSRPGALTAGLNWYRANAKPWKVRDIPNVKSPTMGIWGTKDSALTEQQMKGSGEFVDAEWRYERMKGGHWLMLQHPQEINRLLLDFLAG